MNEYHDNRNECPVRVGTGVRVDTLTRHFGEPPIRADLRPEEKLDEELAAYLAQEDVILVAPERITPTPTTL